MLKKSQSYHAPASFHRSKSLSIKTGFFDRPSQYQPDLIMRQASMNLPLKNIFLLGIAFLNIFLLKQIESNQLEYFLAKSKSGKVLRK